MPDLIVSKNGSSNEMQSSHHQQPHQPHQHRLSGRISGASVFIYAHAEIGRGSSSSKSSHYKQSTVAYKSASERVSDDASAKWGFTKPCDTSLYLTLRIINNTEHQHPQWITGVPLAHIYTGFTNKIFKEKWHFLWSDVKM
ncbi:unnamed protein product [Ceratitis capitata]|uniref:(Mediterranean fruit fly) hypothetical protein n=1 Tax=Ceratitis capitata TaxID=7213 RepID=A0A811UW98_CERCA|nr:unnamed protein product [Ceratitis capitata]